MPQDPNLYGQRAAKKSRRDGALTASLDFTSQLTSLLSEDKGSLSRAGRSRSAKETKESIFTGGKSKRSKAGDDSTNKLQLKEVLGTEEENQQHARSRRKMEDKARLYAAMKRGDYVPKEKEAAPLVDFDRKWAEAVDGQQDELDSSSDDDDDDAEDGAGEIVEYEDEFGRLRRGTRADKERMERRQKRGLLGAEELDRMSARPSAPAKLIFGDAVQSMAFNVDEPDRLDKMEELARKRDRSATPPDQKHYDADNEIRSKGVGFYKFSKDEDTRQQEMQDLAQDRKQTEDKRQEREDQRAARRREIEQRRTALEARKAKRQADNFLDDFTP